MSCPVYPQTKESWLEWLGTVPSHWTLLRLRFMGLVNPSKSEVSHLNRSTEVSFFPMEAIGNDGSLSSEQVRPICEVETGYTYFREGDVTIAKITPCFENGKGAIMRGLVEGVGFGTTELIVVRPNNDRTTSEYLHWLFNSTGFRKLGEGSMYGAGGQKRVPDDFVRNFITAVPPLEEQNAIASFLNRETSKIDALIAEQKRLIDLLKEKRQAVISHSVTKGLNPDAPMKDSGIEWLGMVPAHWEFKRAKDVCTEIIDCKNRTPENFPNGDYLVVRTTCVRERRFLVQGGYFTDLDNFTEWTKKGRPSTSDILFTREAPAGEACLAPTEYAFCLGQRMMYLRPAPQEVTSEFLLYSLYGPLVRQEIDAKSKGSTVGHLRVGEIFNLPVLIPPMNEQVQIAARLIGIEEELNELMGEAEAGISLLQERRSALISAAVTGKIDVRGLVPSDEFSSRPQQKEKIEA